MRLAAGMPNDPLQLSCRRHCPWCEGARGSGHAGAIPGNGALRNERQANQHQPAARPLRRAVPCAKAARRLFAISRSGGVTQPRTPITGLAPHGCHRDNKNLALAEQIHQRELESPVDHPAGALLVLGPSLWCGRCLLLCHVDCRVVPNCQTSTDGDVVLDLVQKLGSSVRVIPDRSHRRMRRRASAWTSSAEMSSTAPLSISATRRSISRSHAASAPVSDSPSKESSSSSARRARSWMGKAFARAESSSTRVGMATSDG